MQHTSLIVSVSAALQFLSAQDGQARAGTFDLVRDGQPACGIVLAENPTAAARLAALELQYHVWKVSGAELPIRLETERVDWKKAAWERLGTAGRMEELGALMAQATQRTGTETERQRVAWWRSALWEWMRQGREQHDASKPAPKPAAPGQAGGLPQ